MAIAYISHPDCQKHDMGHHHPERPARLSAINDRLIASGLEMVLHQHDAPLAARELLEADESVFAGRGAACRRCRGAGG